MAKRATKPTTKTKASSTSAKSTTKTVAQTKSTAAASTPEDTNTAAVAAAETKSTPKVDKAKVDATTKTEAPARNFCDVAALTQQKFTANQNALKAKKVAEKVKNAVAAIEVGKKLSKYTRSALTLLKSEGTVSGPIITKQFETDGLSPGTARAQAQQQTALFKVIGVAKPSGEDGRKLVTDDSKLIDELLASA